jgi:hypothetical protein
MIRPQYLPRTTSLHDVVTVQGRTWDVRRIANGMATLIATSCQYPEQVKPTLYLPVPRPR